MNYPDEQVVDIAQGIDANIATIFENNVCRDLASKNILSDLRSFVEHIWLQIYCHDQHVVFTGPKNEYDTIDGPAKNYVSSRGQYSFLYEFHRLLQKTNSHYVTKVEEGTRLLLHYMGYLSQIREFESTHFHIDILKNLKKFPVKMDQSSEDFYLKASESFQRVKNQTFKTDNAAYYVESKRAIRGYGQSIYEIVLVLANDHASKFNRFTVFTDEDIVPYYSIKAKFLEDSIELLGKKVRIVFMKECKVSIRPVEIDHFFALAKTDLRTERGSGPYEKLMQYIQNTRNTMSDILLMGQEEFDKTFPDFANENTQLGNAIKKMHSLVNTHDIGWNTVVYLALEMRNTIILSQKPRNPDDRLNSCFTLSKGVYAFEKNTFFRLIACTQSTAILFDKVFQSKRARG